MTDSTPKTIKTPYKDRYAKSNVSAMPGVNLEAVTVSKTDEEDSKELMPRGITAAQKKIWLRLGSVMVASGRLNDYSADSFLEYCDVKVEMDTLKKFRKANGYTYETIGRHGEQIKLYPEIAQLNTLRIQFFQMCAHFGLTPATESRVNEAKALEESNPFKK